MNWYRVPVQPGPDTGPSSATLAPDCSRASTACGLNGRLELKSHASCAPADLYGRYFATHSGSIVQSLPPVPYALVSDGRIFVYAFPPTMRVCHPLEIVSWPRFRFRSSSPVIRSGDRTPSWAGTAVTVRSMRKLPAAARDSALAAAASAGGAVATVTVSSTTAAVPAAAVAPPATISARDRRRLACRRRTARSRPSTAVAGSAGTLSKAAASRRRASRVSSACSVFHGVLHQRPLPSFTRRA